MKTRILPMPESARLSAISRQVHPRCVVCNASNPMGLGLEFLVTQDGAVQAEFCGSEALEGYPGLLHGGLIGALLDSAMTNCLFAHDCAALTAELAVRYRHPVTAIERMIVRAWKTESQGPLHVVHAELRQNDIVKATAYGKFFESAKLPAESSSPRKAPFQKGGRPQHPHQNRTGERHWSRITGLAGWQRAQLGMPAFGGLKCWPDKTGVIPSRAQPPTRFWRRAWDWVRQQLHSRGPSQLSPPKRGAGSQAPPSSNPPISPGSLKNS